MDENTSLFSKKADELTVGENIKVAVGVTVAMTALTIAIPVVVIGVLSMVEKISLKRQERKALKQAEETVK